MSDDELNLKDVDFDKVLKEVNLGGGRNNNTPSFFQKSSDVDSVQKVNKVKIPREQLIKLIDEKLRIIHMDINYYDELFKRYRDLNRGNKEKLPDLSNEEIVIMYQEELHLIKELIIENSFLVPTIKKVKEEIIRLIDMSGQILIGTGHNIDNIKKNLDEYIKIYSNHAYQGNQISIILREIHKLDKKNLVDMTNIDFINE